MTKIYNHIHIKSNLEHVDIMQHKSIGDTVEVLNNQIMLW